jgi:hypothetical protein
MPILQGNILSSLTPRMTDTCCQPSIVILAYGPLLNCKKPHHVEFKIQITIGFYQPDANEREYKMRHFERVAKHRDVHDDARQRPFRYATVLSLLIEE